MGAAAGGCTVPNGGGPLPTLCQLRLGVRGVSASNFTVALTTENGTTTLLSGAPFTGEVVPAMRMRYDTIAAQDGTSPVSITVNPISGDPDLFVSNNAAAFAVQNYCASATGFFTDRITITATSPCFCGGPPCTYYVGVLAAGRVPASYSIEGDARPVAIQTLIDGNAVYSVSGASRGRREVP